MDYIEIMKKSSKRRYLILAAIILTLVIISITFGAKIWLYLNFLFGNDIVLKLESDTQYLQIQKYQEQTIQFRSLVRANPFCSAFCEADFSDISNNKTIEKTAFNLRPTIPLTKEYILKIEKHGSGLSIYRFSITCSSVSTNLCHTSEQPTRRDALVFVSYNLSPEEEILKENIKPSLDKISDTTNNLISEQIFINSTINRLKNTTLISNLESNFSVAKSKIDDTAKETGKISDLWENQDYFAVNSRLTSLTERIKSAKEGIQNINKTLFITIGRYNLVLDTLNQIKEDILNLPQQYLESTEQLDEIKSNIEKTAVFVSQKNLLTEKEKSVYTLQESAKSIILENKKQVLGKNIELDIEFDSLCIISGECINHTSIKDRENQTDFEDACKRVKDLREIYKKINSSINLTPENYSDSSSFWSNITAKVNNIREEKKLNYLSQITNQNNTLLIKEVLKTQTLIPTENYSEYNITKALLVELIEQQPKECIQTQHNLTAFIPDKFELPIQESISLIKFGEPNEKCCVFGLCNKCCQTQDCNNNPKNYPIIFLHGHAFNKDTSADYSLDAFNKIQAKLEEDGFMNAGSISLYTSNNLPFGLFGLPEVPVTFKVSYYFDLFKEPDNYIVVQTKSENIDTYSVRLKDLIDTVKYMTGKPKVVIIAHSMGGLVSRRYLQIFGSNDVAKLIMIGTPNKGIAGSTSDYCPLLGESLECRDMSSDSLFINKLNRGPLPSIPIYNIVGSGCQMPLGDGDGTVLKDKAILNNTNNIFIEGNCEDISNPLHVALLDIDKYPETYSAIKQALINDLNAAVGQSGTPFASNKI